MAHIERKNMEIKYINHNTIDVFIGKGWDSWGRFKIAHRKDGSKVFQIAGNNFPEKEKQSLEQIINE